MSPRGRIRSARDCDNPSEKSTTQRGLKLCDRFLAGTEPSDVRNLTQVRALRTSFLNGLGITEHDEVGEEYDRDAFKGGD